jgi:predicted HTH transcriptional regulator
MEPSSERERTLFNDYVISTGTPGQTRKTPELILDALRASPRATLSELAALQGKSESAIERAVRKLREQGRLQRVGANKGGVWEVKV